MSRVTAIVGLVFVLMATGVAAASTSSQVRLPVSVGPSSDTGKDGGSVVVAKGDHLWKISARHLGDEATDDDIAPYWRQVVEINTPQLRSGDPNLIYPGEVVELPAIRERP